MFIGFPLAAAICEHNMVPRFVVDIDSIQYSLVVVAATNTIRQLLCLATNGFSAACDEECVTVRIVLLFNLDPK